MSLGSKKISGTCPMCESFGPLCNSHIIPEFCYKGMYDDKGRAFAIDTVDIDTDKYIQSGLKEYMLCPTCEGILAKNEKVFSEEWLVQNRPREMEGRVRGQLEGLAYANHKLFHLGVLFKSHFSTLPNFAEVCLPEIHVKRLRNILWNDCAPDSLHYPVLCIGLELGGRVEKDLVGPAHRTYYEGHWAYHFTFAGGQWIYFISSHGLQELFKNRLKEDGTVSFVVMGHMAMKKLYRPAYQKRKSMDK
jgi:hypothetical protein